MPFPDPTLIVHGICAAAYLAVAASLLLRRRLHDPSTRLALALVAVSLGITVALGLRRAQEIALLRGFDTYALGRIAAYLLPVTGALFYLLTRRLARRGITQENAPGEQSPTVRSRLGWGAAALAMLLAAAVYENPFRLPDALFSAGGETFMRWHVAFLLLALAWGALMFAAVLLTLRDYQRIRSPLHRNRGKYWSITLALATAGGGLFMAQMHLPGNLLHAFAVTLAAVVALTYNLPDLRLALRESTRYGIVTAITVAVYAGCILGAQRFLRGVQPGHLLLMAAGLAAALAVLVNPLLHLVDTLLRRLISGEHYDPGQALSQYSLSISNILDLERLASIAIGLISEALDITHGALVTVTRYAGTYSEKTLPLKSVLASKMEEAAGGSAARGESAASEDGEREAVYVLRSVSGMGEALAAGRLRERCPAAYYLRREHHPLSQYDIDLLPRFQSMLPEEREWLSSLNMDLYVPIYAQGEWIGLLALGAKASGDRYFDEDLAFLQTIADQTAVALENARLFENLKERNAENELLNAELQSANEELARLDHAKTDFINIASHELRTPLTQVMGFNDILSEIAQKGRDAEAIQMTEAVHRAARRLEEIVETMFDVTKLDTRTLDLHCVPVAPATIAGAAVDAWRKGIAERHLTVQMVGLNDLPNLQVDARRMTQVFSQLVQNAVKSTPDGGQITITGRMVEADRADGNGAPLPRWMELVVADNGIGIAPEELERIFERFYRVGNVLLHSSGDTKFKGAGPGLGLTIARGIVEAHGGRIWAESRGYDETACPGAAFHVLLPAGNNSTRP